MEYTGARIIVTLLERQGIGTVAGIPGGANLPLYDALRASPIRHVLARHEQGAGFIAQGFARATGRIGVCFASSGPGATNLVTALADAMSDSIPIVAITGQVPTSLLGTNAFQEVDTVGMTAPVVKRAFFVKTTAALLDVIPEAFALAQSGRQGPVVIDVPKDVQTGVAEVSAWPEPGRRAPFAKPEGAPFSRIADLIEEAERPILYIGGGVIASGASLLVRELAHRADLPVTSSLQGLGAFPADDPLSLGMLGMHAAPSTNHALDECDFLLAIGVRFDDRATGKVSEFCKRSTIVHIDADPREIGKIKPVQYRLVADAHAALSALLPLVRPKRRPAWRARIRTLAATHPLPFADRGAARFLRTLAARLPRTTIVTTDVGQHQMWVAQAYPFTEPRTLLTSGGLGTMGFGLPTAIGAALAHPGRRVVCITGDGSLLMNIQELATLAELDLPVTVVVLNNGHLGLVRQQQELFYGERYHPSRFERKPDFAAIARGFGILGVDADLDEALRAPGPVLLDIPISPTENVLPMVPPGAANRDMIGAT